ncbi:hypothetical protein ACOJUR_09020 [Alicyclobacillus tolerans]|uniref:Uncharacterized protein n=2 Tax=Alicyclobacillus tolerans TaxID=90970 RepID=A0A1M6ME01_9BACL|nr:MULTISPECIES: hypothetical protein [Alicyclobacillus]MDP9728240.1 hypothetical protein [Alicyclobacillus tengchongensis]QRF23454.1 hypothetical protein FY534_07085 [Alicyclobacillus sp. TC]SHJ81667.1 hypothetical protein SAMN05443507_10424 [Alicyclobacillus montanus]
MEDQNAFANLKSWMMKIDHLDSCSFLIMGKCNVVMGGNVHQKENSGFGSLAPGSTMIGCLSMVYDVDGVDMPIDNRNSIVWTSRTE